MGLLSFALAAIFALMAFFDRPIYRGAVKTARETRGPTQPLGFPGKES
jgi:hypothetical protein